MEGLIMLLNAYIDSIIAQRRPGRYLAQALNELAYVIRCAYTVGQKVDTSNKTFK